MTVSPVMKLLPYARRLLLLPHMPLMLTDPHTSLAAPARVGSRPPSAEVLFS